MGAARVQDAFNLGWKLAAVAQQRAPRELLDTYQTERAPVVSRLVKGTRTFTRLVLLGNPLATAARRGIASRVMSHPGPQHTLAQALSELDITYRSRSRIGKRSPLAAGDRAPNVQVRNRSTGTVVGLFDVFDHKRHTLMIVGPDQPEHLATAAPHTDQVRVVRIVHDDESVPADGDSVIVDPQGEVAKRYTMPTGGYALIRPDGYIGALGADGDADDVSHYLQKTFT